jgi:hypothetical protein
LLNTAFQSGAPQCFSDVCLCCFILFCDTFTCVPCCFLVYGKYLPLCPLFLFLLFYHPSPDLLYLSLCPFTLWAYYSIIYLFSLNSLLVTNYFLLFNHLFVFFEFLIIYKLLIILVINLSVLCVVLCPFLFGVRLGTLPLVIVAGSCRGCVHWTPSFLLDLVYHILSINYVICIQML